jgi:arsenite methyltransferase
MADLTTADTTPACCSATAQSSCCEPSAKASCCETSAAGGSCGCSEGRSQDSRETVREKYAAAAEDA